MPSWRRAFRPFPLGLEIGITTGQPASGFASLAGGLFEDLGIAHEAFMVEAVNHHTMPKVTFEILPKHRKLMDAHPEVNWSAVFRKAIERQSESAWIAERIREEMEDPRVQALAAALKAGIGKRWRDAHGD